MGWVAGVNVVTPVAMSVDGAGDWVAGVTYPRQWLCR